jgi:DnaJ domain
MARRPDEEHRAPHQVLGVSARASADDVRRAYREAARKLHPDRNPDPSAAARFEAVKAARDRMLARIAAREGAAERASERAAGGGRPWPAAPSDPGVGPRPPPFDPSVFETYVAPPTYRELARVALYVTGAVVWFSAMCGLMTLLSVTRRPQPPPTPPPDPTEEAAEEEPLPGETFEIGGPDEAR